MFGYESCLSCKLYHLKKELEDQTCGLCSPREDHLASQTPLSTPQYERLYEQRLKAVKHFLKPSLPAYPSDVFGCIETHKEE